jgi:hypothetical protein
VTAVAVKVTDMVIRERQMVPVAWVAHLLLDLAEIVFVQNAVTK